MFPDLTKHPEWLSGQSREWCNQLAAMTGKYEYTWNYIYEGQPAENRLTEKLTSRLHGKVLEVGCGHGDYTKQWAELVEEMVGYDMTEGFLATAERNRTNSNVRYVRAGNSGKSFRDCSLSLRQEPRFWIKFRRGWKQAASRSSSCLS
ncbi:class I SAM-dependent methyltransferase [Paenibacillus aurantius]|uniref:class I SAM-dependent methyltransferase n=1 Tax=Paenibacillus aurantius TaxID=2918900 RepID=UPI00387F94C2